MPTPFDPSPYQPLQPYFDIQIGGLSKIYEGPNIPIGLDVHFSSSEMSTAVISLFDEAALEVDPNVWKAAQESPNFLPTGTIQWGYKGNANIDSAVYDIFIQNAKPRFKDNAFYVTIFAFIDNITSIASSNSMSGTLTQILNTFCQVHNLQGPIITPAFGIQNMQEYGATDRDTTAFSEKKHVTQISQSDWRSLRDLVAWAVDDQGAPGYCPVIRDGTLYISKTQQSTADYQYVVQKDNSVTIDWNPDVTYLPIWDQSDVHFNGHQVGTGYTHKVALDPVLTAQYQALLGGTIYPTTSSQPTKSPPTNIQNFCAESMAQNITNGAIRARNAVTRSGAAGWLPNLYSHIKNWLGTFSAELTVCGDPQVDILSDNSDLTIVDVEFRLPINYFNTNNNALHYTSGKYIATEVFHHLGIDGYFTTYGLQRAAMFDEPEVDNSNDIPSAGSSNQLSNISVPIGGGSDLGGTV